MTLVVGRNESRELRHRQPLTHRQIGTRLLIGPA